MSSLHVVVLAGGRGTRFWPKSRAARPKQLLPIVAERTMIQATVDRMAGLAAPESIWVVTGADHADEMRAQLPEIPPEQIVVEPMGRNTAPAIGLAAALIAKRDPEAVMVVLPADHHIGDPAGLRSALATAAEVAAGGGRLVTIGIPPQGPETGYGYIERGAPIDGGAHAVKRFTEKPTLEVAEGFLATGNYFWNAGMFIWRVDAILAALAAFRPEMSAALDAIVANWGDAAAFARGYESITGESIDYAVLERSEAVVVVPGEFGWDDIGSWTALERLWPADSAGNVTRGDVVALEASGNLVDAGGRLVALLGVDDLVVVSTDDAVLVCPKSRAQEIKRILDELGPRGLARFE